MIFSLLLSAILTYAGEPPCQISSQQKLAYLKMSYQDFDQRIDGGWRTEFQKKCVAQSARLIDLYRSANRIALRDDEVRILFWHAAQLYGMLGQMKHARPRFLKSFDPREPANGLVRWNSYVRGTLAYFEFDLDALIAAREDVVLGGGGSQNLAILDGMIRCFDRPRSEAYSKKCGATRSLSLRDF